MKPNTAEKVEAAQRKQKSKSQLDVKAKAREFKAGDSVYVRNYLQVTSGYQVKSLKRLDHKCLL